MLAVVALILGVMLWTGNAGMLQGHIGVGFLVSIAVFILSIMAILNKAIGIGVAGVVFAFLLPLVGFLQLPATYHTLRLIQVIHVMVGLMALGIAERIYSAIQSAR